MSTKAIEQFLRPPSEGGAYTDERLAMLLAHSEDGKLIWNSCCCFVGIANAPHALMGKANNTGSHYWEAVKMVDDLGYDAALEFYADGVPTDSERRAKLIPLILAEMDRRVPKTPEAGSGDSIVTPASILQHEQEVYV